MAVTINGSAGVTTNSGAVYDSLQRGTAITLTNQTAPDFTAIPSWVRRITLMLSGVSTNSTGAPLVQLGTGSTTYVTSGYVFYVAYAGGTTQTAGTNSTTGLSIDAGISGNAANLRNGSIVFTNITGNTWSYVWNGSLFNGTGYFSFAGSGSIALGAALTAVRLFVDGTQQFDAGTINIIYE